MRLSSLAVLALVLAATPCVAAQQLVYQPRNPAFGGNPLNYSGLLGAAQAQNDYEDERSSLLARDPLADFESNLQRQILNSLAREIITSRFGDIDLSQAGTYNFGDFTIEITPGIDGISIRIFNLLTGDESVVTVPSFP